jgi:hypothetical protein
MTFTEIRTELASRLNLTSTDAQARLGAAINRHYRRITSLIGLDAARFVTRSASMTIGVQTVTFTSIEKIDRILDTTDASAIRLLPESSIHTLRSLQPGSGQPSMWATQNTDAQSVTVRFDTVPQSAYSLQADGWTSLADLVGDDEPAFPASFHDILTWFVLAEEYLRKEKQDVAAAYEQKAERLLADLRFHLADSPTRLTRQADSPLGAFGSSAGSGGGIDGGTSYTQSGLLTFDRGAGVAPFAVAQATAAKVDNLDADKLDGQHGSYYTNASNISTGTIDTARLANIANAQIAAAAAIAWSKISKSGSSLADLATRSAADLSSGTLPDARFPATLPAASGANLTALNPANLSAVVPIAKGGTALSTTPTNGQLLIGNGTNYTLATPSGTGITVTGGSGTLALTAATRSIASTATNAAFSNTSAEQTLFSATIPGGTMGTSKTVYYASHGKIVTDGGGSRNVNFQVKFGGTTLCGNSNLSFAATSTFDYLLEVWLSPYNNTSTGVQVMARVVTVNTAGVTTWIADGTVKAQTASQANVAVTHSSDQTFAVTATMDVADASFSITRYAGSLVLLG